MKKFLLLFLLLSTPAMAADIYYVNKSGSDSNSCAAAKVDGATAKLTITSAATCPSPGDTVQIGAGVYYEKLDINVSGTSGNPIMFRGTYAAGHQTIIDGSTALATWTEDAATCGAGCYVASPTEKAYWVGVSDANGLHPIMRSATATYLNQASDADWCDSIFTYTCVPYWDGIDAVWMGTGTPTGANLTAYTDGASPGSVWVRFTDGADPDTKTMRYSGFAPVVDLEGRSYITLKDLHIRGGQREINIVDADNIIINNVELSTGGWQIYLKDSDNITIQNSQIHTNRIDSDYTGGAWNRYYGSTLTYPTTGTTRYIAAIKEKYYSALKECNWNCYYTGYAINPYQNTGATNINFLNNEVYDKDGTGFDLNAMSDVEVSGNTFRNISGVAVLPYLDYQQAHVHGNLFDDNNINLRFNEMDTDPTNLKEIFFYNNRLYLPDGLGGHIYWSWAVDDAAAGLHEQYIFHNSFLGGYGIMQMSYWAAATGLPNAFIFNNIMSVGDVNPSWWVKSSEGRVGYGVFGGFSNNWVGFLAPTEVPFDGEGNVISTTTGFWSESAIPDWATLLPAAEETGVDVTSATLTINGTVIGAMPGFTTGYFTGSAPNMGTYDFGDITPPTFGSITATKTGVDTVQISWSPSEPATGWIEYGPTVPYAYETIHETSYLSFHAQSITGLSAGQTIHYRIAGQDQAGNTGYSDDYVYTHAGDFSGGLLLLGIGD
jgi:hypothetical protein